MISNIKFYKTIIIVITIVIVLTVIFLTIDTITETGNWELFDIDFKDHSDIASAYGTLIGGILAFLSILFVFFGLLEQREQILVEKRNNENEMREDLLDRLKLLSSFLKSAIDEVISQGKRMKVFYEGEKLAPSDMNTMYFNTNKNFGRLIDMDNMSLYKSYQLYFGENPKWDGMFLNTYNLIDFYSDALRELREKYTFHINDKVKEQKQIGYDLHKFLNLGSRLVDEYLVNYGLASYLTYPWSLLINDFTPDYYDYLKECENKGEVPDYRLISDQFLLPFLEACMYIRKTYGYDSYGSREIVEIVSYIRKKIREVEVYSLQYAGDIEKYYTEYFSEENDNVKMLRKIKIDIDEVIKKNTK